MNSWLIPKSLGLRLFIVLMTGLLSAVLMTSGIAERERARIVKEFKEEGSAQRTADYLHLLALLDPSQRLEIVKNLPSGEWKISPYESTKIPVSTPSFAKVLTEAAAPSIRVESAWRNSESECRSGFDVCASTIQIGAVVRFADGMRVLVEVNRERVPLPSEFIRYTLDLTFLSACIAFVAWFAMRLLLTPLQKLSDAADAFGKNLNYPSIDETGPNEVKKAAQALNRMRDRLRAHAEERTHILASITHDLKTPLTRMRLRLEQVENVKLRTRLEDDIAGMHSLINEGLALARSLDSKKPSQSVDLTELLHKICDDAKGWGSDVVFEGEQHAFIMANRDSLERAFLNIIENAIKHAGSARVFLEREGYFWLIRVRDSGPGIPEDQISKVMMPFFRVERSRSRDSGGTGLGLSIAENLITTQKGTIKLANLFQGGLEVSVRLLAQTKITQKSI